MSFFNIGADAQGIISFERDNSGKRYYNPFLIALQSMLGDVVYSDYMPDTQNLIPRYVPLRYLMQDELSKSHKCAQQWLLEHVSKEGDAAYWNYDYGVEFAGASLTAGWHSAYGQAYVALAMMYWFQKTAEQQFKELCIGALNGLCRDIVDGGCARQLSDGAIWFEEIPVHNATHIFNAHMVALLALIEAQKILKLDCFDEILQMGINALEKYGWKMKVGTKSAYDMPRNVPLHLQIDVLAKKCQRIALGSITVDDGNKHEVDMKASSCFAGKDYASGIDWTAEYSAKGCRFLNNGAELRDVAVPGGAVQNTFINFEAVNLENGITSFLIEYEAENACSLILKKLTINGYIELDSVGPIELQAGYGQKTVRILTQDLIPEVSDVYHKYHLDLLTELVHQTSNNSFLRLLESFRCVETKTTSMPIPKLSSLSVVLNLECGLFCKMCDIGQENEKASIYGFLKKDKAGIRLDYRVLLKRCAELTEPLELVHIVGTEPTLYPDLPMLVKGLKALNIKVFVTTNGINLKKMLVPLLESGVDKIMISLDGPADVHDNIRGRQGLFHEIMLLLKQHEALLEKCRALNQEIVACCAVTPLNYLYLSEFIEALPENVIKDVWLTHMNYILKDVAEIHNRINPHYSIGESCTDESVAPDKINPWRLYCSIIAAKEKARKKMMKFAEAPYISTVREYEDFYHRPCVRVGRDMCMAPFFTMQINADGSGCVMSRCYDVKIGNIYHTSLEQMFYSDEMNDLRKNIMHREQWLPCYRCCAIM